MISSRPWCHIVVILTVTSICVPLILLYARNKPFSKVFKLFNHKDSVISTARQLNNERFEAAKNYWRSVTETKQHFTGKSDLVVVIVTVKRKAYDSSQLGYVLQSVAATHKLLLSDRVFTNKTMMICNVDTNPQNYTEIVELKPYIHVVERYGTSSLPISMNRSRTGLYNNKFYSNKYHKETVDYMFCLESAYSLGAKYVLLMEDDAIPMKDALEVVMNKIQYLDSKNRHYSYIKLYYPQKWQGYAYELTRILELVSIGCVGAGILVMFHFLLCKSKAYYLQMSYFLCGVWLFILSAMILGRQNIYDLYRISKYLYTLKPSPGCCTQAVLYTSRYIPILVDFLSSKQKALHTDLAIYNFTKMTGIPAYQVEPNLFYHVGMYTSLSSEKHKNAEEFIFNAL